MVSKVVVVVMTTTMTVMHSMMIMYGITVFLTVGRMLECVTLNRLDTPSCNKEGSSQGNMSTEQCQDVFCLLISSFLHQSLSGVFVTYNRIHGQRASGLLFLFWCFLALCGAVQYHHELTDVDSEQVRVCSKCRLSCVTHTHTHTHTLL